RRRVVHRTHVLLWTLREDPARPPRGSAAGTAAGPPVPPGPPRHRAPPCARMPPGPAWPDWPAWPAWPASDCQTLSERARNRLRSSDAHRVGVIPSPPLRCSPGGPSIDCSVLLSIERSRGGRLTGGSARPWFGGVSPPAGRRQTRPGRYRDEHLRG